MLAGASRLVESRARDGHTVRVEFTSFGRRALLVEVEGTDQALALALWARSARLPVVDIVPAATTVLFDGVGDLATLQDRLAGWTPSAEAQRGEEVEVAVTYDGDDLEEVAAAWGTDPDGVVRRHQETVFVSAFCGFAPGFAYLAGLPDELAVRRLDTPRSRVPAGAVALAGTWCGIYPTPSPGGWRVIGRTDAVLWDPSRSAPALLAPGTRISFVSA